MHASRSQVFLRALSGLLYAILVSCGVGCAIQPEVPATPDVPAIEKRVPQGLLILADRSLEIAPQEFDYTGEATFEWPSGRRQQGTFKAGKLHGNGTETFQGSTYSGGWDNGRKHGQGQLTLADKTTYMGGFAAGKKSGFGMQRDPNGTTYEGEWQADQRHGFGAETDHKSSVYEGSWERDHKSGYGEMRYPNQVVYAGMWQDDKAHGFGKEIRPDRSYYEGAWQHGERHGEGLESYADGSRHEGTWQEGRILGPGTRTNRAGIQFTGPWTLNVMSTGLLTLPDGAQYAGALFGARGRALQPELLAWLQSQDSPFAYYFLGAAYIDFDTPAPDVPTATTWFERAAGGGVAEAQYRLALIRRADDPQASLALLQSATAKGHGSAAALLGEFYHIGLFVEKNLNVAKELYEQAAKRGNLNAINNLAWLLATTLSELADPKAAVKLIQPLVVYLGNWQHLDTLAAAHARLGNMDLAKDLQTQALLRARNHIAQIEDQTDVLLDANNPSASLSDTIVEMEDRLNAYTAAEPYTE